MTTCLTVYYRWVIAIVAFNATEAEPIEKNPTKRWRWKSNLNHRPRVAVRTIDFDLSCVDNVFYGYQACDGILRDCLLSLRCFYSLVSENLTGQRRLAVSISSMSFDVFMSSAQFLRPVLRSADNSHSFMFMTDYYALTNMNFHPNVTRRHVAFVCNKTYRELRPIDRFERMS